MKTYRDLIVWQKSMDLVFLVYKATNQFPKEEVYNLTSQIRRSAVYVASNITKETMFPDFFKLKEEITFEKNTNNIR